MFGHQSIKPHADNPNSGIHQLDQLRAFARGDGLLFRSAHLTYVQIGS
jgi:hypothetical protein